jgi:hypothetical protein
MKASSLMHYKVSYTETTGKSGRSTSTGDSIPAAPVSNSMFPSGRKNRSNLATGTIEAESSLWRAVLCQAIRDIYDRDERIRQEALRWVLSRDFATVCDMAFVEPDCMKEQIANLSTMSIGLARKFGQQLQAYVAKDEE